MELEDLLMLKENLEMLASERDPKTGYGYYAISTHNSDWSSIYAHMPVYAYQMVPEGSQVVQGQVIGYVGNSGASTGPHLHFGVYYNGSAVDPAKFLDIT